MRIVLRVIVPLRTCRVRAYASWIVEENEGHRNSPSGPWRRTQRRRSPHTRSRVPPPTNLKSNIGKTGTPHPLPFWRVQALAPRLNVAFRGATAEVAVHRSTASIIVHPHKAVAESGANTTAFVECWIGYESTWHSFVYQCCLALGWRLGGEVLCSLSLRIATGMA